MLPTAAFSADTSSPRYADSTVVTSTSSDFGAAIEPPAIITTKGRKASERRHSLPTSVVLSVDSNIGNTLTQPVPEFLCHLFTMLRDENLRDVMSWQVPTTNETDDMGGGIKGIGKIVCHQPHILQESVLGKYYRHSKYASFQRQLNYFGFKKRLHGGKKGKLSPCSYVHEGLSAKVESLLGLKRRPPLKKRLSMELDSGNSVSSEDEEEQRPKKRRNSTGRGRKNKCKSSTDKKATAKKPEHITVHAEEYGAPSLVAATATSVAPRPIQVPPVAQEEAKTGPAPASATLAAHQLFMSSTLPPAEELFDFGDFELPANGFESNSGEDANNGFYVNDQGRCLSQNSLVQLAMFY